MSRPPTNGMIASAIMCGADQFGDTTSTVAQIARIAPATRGALIACLNGTPMPSRSHTTPEMTMPEISEVWKIATPRKPTVTPSESTITAPHRPAKKFHRGISPRTS